MLTLQRVCCVCSGAIVHRNQLQLLISVESTLAAYCFFVFRFFECDLDDYNVLYYRPHLLAKLLFTCHPCTTAQPQHKVISNSTKERFFSFIFLNKSAFLTNIVADSVLFSAHTLLCTCSGIVRGKSYIKYYTWIILC